MAWLPNEVYAECKWLIIGLRQHGYAGLHCQHVLEITHVGQKPETCKGVLTHSQQLSLFVAVSILSIQEADNSQRNKRAKETICSKQQRALLRVCELKSM